MTHPGRPAPLAIDALPHIADGVPRALLMRALAATSEISLITDAAQNILHASRSFTTITGYSEQEMLGSNCRVLQGPGTSREVVKTIRDTLARGEEFRGDILNYRKDGSPFWNALKVTPLLGDDGRPTHFVSVQRDVTTRMALHEQLRFQATHDAVTGLPNRAALDPHLTGALEGDGGPGARIAVGLLDLDGLRNVNNALGHDAGDEVLAGWAARLQARLLPGEFLARMGGDEFVLVVEDVPEDGAREALADVLERLGGSVESAFDAGGGAVRVGMSAGLALSPRDGTETRGLLRSADTALKLAKSRENGRGQWWELAGPVGSRPAASQAAAAPEGAGPAAEPRDPGAAPGDGTAAAAPDAATGYTERLFNGGLRMFLQPAVDLSQGGVYLFEALARLQLEDGGYVPPAAFLPHLEPADVDRLFRLGLEQVLAQLAEWDAAGFSTKVSINLAPTTLVDPGFPAFVEEALAGTTSNPHAWSWNSSKPRARNGTCSVNPSATSWGWVLASLWTISAPVTAASSGFRCCPSLPSR